MSKLKFSDGVEIDTDGELRSLELKDGWYVTGQGLLIPVRDEAEAKTIIRDMKSKANESRILRLYEFDSSSMIMGEPLPESFVINILEIMQDNPAVQQFKGLPQYQEENLTGYYKKGVCMIAIKGDSDRNVLQITLSTELKGKPNAFRSTQATINP
jgi:hypothetical protein